jgi:[ribosomal protein S5]-alanine N-acetyltransferase
MASPSDLLLNPPSFELHTPRLYLRPIAPTDLAALHAMLTHPQVRRFLCDDRILPLEQVAEWIEESAKLFQTERFGLWGMFPRFDRVQFLGFCGFWYFHTPPELELAYALNFDYWGQGLATEAARAMLHYGFEQLKLDRIAASTDEPNTASRRVLEKLGMSLVRRSQPASSVLVHYAISATTNKHQ